MNGARSELTDYTVDDVATHNRDDDLWIIIHGEVFDVTKYIHDHPGGAEILSEIAGCDGSEEFDSAGHSEDAYDIKKELLVGRVKGEGLKPTRKAVRLIAPATSAPPSKAQGGGFSSVMAALSVGLGASVVFLGVWWNAAGFSAPQWFTVRRKGFGFTEGVLMTSGAFALAMGYAVQRFMTSFAVSTKFPPHMQLPRIAKPDVFSQRGWLDPAVFQKLPLVKKELLGPNAYRFVFALPTPDTVVGLPIGQHVSIQGQVNGKMVSRSYTPISNNFDRGVLELVIRCYPDGALTNGYMRQLKVGDEVQFRGPKGGIRYRPGMCERAGMIAGGTGITPMYQLIRAICENPRDTTEVMLIYANRSEQDILLRAELDSFARRYPKIFKIFYVLDEAPKEWNGGHGFVNTEMMEQQFGPKTAQTKIFLCGPPPMVDGAKKSLGTLGFQIPGAITKPGDDILCF